MSLQGPMIDGLLCLLVLAAAAAAGLACLRALGAAPRVPADRLLDGLAVGLGIAGMLGLGLAALGVLRPVPIALAGVVALTVGRRELAAALGSVQLRPRRADWPLVLVCALVLAAELPAMLAPPIGGDQTKYQLVYPRLYAAHGALVATPWSIWGQMQFVANFVFAIGFALRDDVLARLLNGAFGVCAALALGRLVREHLASRAAVAAGALFFTLPITCALMTRAGSDLSLVLYSALAVGALLVWRTGGRPGDLRRTGIMAGLAGGTKVMGLLIPALVVVAMVTLLVQRTDLRRHAIGGVAAFGLLLLIAASPYYVRNAVETGNPIYPFGYGLFGGRDWSAAASEYLDDFYRQYETTHAVRRDATPYGGLELLRFPWDLTMHPDWFERTMRQSVETGPFALAFAPALLIVRRRRAALLATASIGFGQAALIAAGAWPDPRYLLPGMALVLVAALAAVCGLVPRRLFAAIVVLTIAGNLAVTSRLLRPLWADQLRVAVGRLAPDEFLRRHSPLFGFWERANAEVPRSGLVLVLEKTPHPYYVARPFILASYLEQGMIDYRTVSTPATVAAAARRLGVTHVAVDLAALDAGSDPFEARVARLWRGIVTSECDPPLVRAADYALYALRPEFGPTALASSGMAGR